MAWTNTNAPDPDTGIRPDTSRGDVWEFTAAGGSQKDFTADAVNDEAVNDSKLEATRAAQAEAAGVKDARFAGYAAVLANYEKRSDTEHLADRRARELAVTADQQDFTREADYDGNSGETKDSDYTG